MPFFCVIITRPDGELIEQCNFDVVSDAKDYFDQCTSRPVHLPSVIGLYSPGDHLLDGRYVQADGTVKGIPGENF